MKSLNEAEKTDCTKQVIKTIKIAQREKYQIIITDLGKLEKVVASIYDSSFILLDRRL